MRINSLYDSQGKEREFKESARRSVDSMVATANRVLLTREKMVFMVHREKRGELLSDDGVPMSRKTRFYSRLNKLKHKPLVSRSLSTARDSPPLSPSVTFFQYPSYDSHRNTRPLYVFPSWIPWIFYYVPRTRQGQGCGIYVGLSIRHSPFQMEEDTDTIESNLFPHRPRELGYFIA